MSKVSRKPRSGKVGKPHPDFPLFIHGTGYKRWAKKIRGTLHYFGPVEPDPKGEKALERWLAEKDDLLAGRTPRPKVEGFGPGFKKPSRKVLRLHRAARGPRMTQTIRHARRHDVELVVVIARAVGH